MWAKSSPEDLGQSLKLGCLLKCKPLSRENSSKDKVADVIASVLKDPCLMLAGGTRLQLAPSCGTILSTSEVPFHELRSFA
jgi:hypothetical protein